MRTLLMRDFISIEGGRKNSRYGNHQKGIELFSSIGASLYARQHKRALAPTSKKQYEPWARVRFSIQNGTRQITDFVIDFIYLHTLTSMHFISLSIRAFHESSAFRDFTQLFMISCFGGKMFQPTHPERFLAVTQFLMENNVLGKTMI